MADKYPWKFTSIGGSVRIKIDSGEDIRHLGELDRKMWTVLSCPVTNLEFDDKALKAIDVDGDGKIRVDEVIASAQWITRVLKNADILLKDGDSVNIEDFNADDPDGARLQASARQILKNLGLEKDEIAIEDTADNVKIFAGTQFNGDGVITPASAADEATSKLIETIASVASTMDRSGVAGVTADQIEAFYAACEDFDAWARTEVLPYGENTADAYSAVTAIEEKMDDFFMRCKLIAFDEEVVPAVGIKIEEVAAGDIASQPIAKPSAEGKLPLKALNPAWKDAVEKVVKLTGFKGDEMTEQEWNEILGKHAPYAAWLGTKKGAQVESLGAEAVAKILKENKKAALMELIEKDKAEEANALSIEEVDKVLRLRKSFYRFLCNYVVFSDFYDIEKKAMFQAGRLYIDQRSTDLCIKVDGPSAEISGLSGMYILYCSCTSEKLGKSFNIAAVLTDGDTDGMREGKNAVFYDRDGNDYTAKVIAIVDNPVSVRQAFWSPYKKVGRMINDWIDKKAAEKNEKSMSGLTATVEQAQNVDVVEGDGKQAAAAVTSSFDIAKFAGIFAAIGMALGFIGEFVVAVVKGAASLTIWQLLLVIVAIMLLISGPSMFIAWRKLKKRDLGPVLNANGWAINAQSLVGVKFGKTLTNLAAFPRLTKVDPVARRKRFWKRFLWCFVLLLAAAAAAYYFFFM